MTVAMAQVYSDNYKSVTLISEHGCNFDMRHGQFKHGHALLEGIRLDLLAKVRI